jgi:hypothetical protein
VSLANVNRERGDGHFLSRISMSKFDLWRRRRDGKKIDGIELEMIGCEMGGSGESEVKV